MFAENEKISSEQLKRMLVLDWIGKSCIFLPVLLSSLSGREKLGALLLGGMAAYVYAEILERLAGKVGGSFREYLTERLGNIGAWVVGALFFIYFLCHQAYLALTVGRVVRQFLLPEVPEIWIAVLTLASGWTAVRGSVQRRGRMAECLYPVIMLFLSVMLICAAASVKYKNLVQTADFELTTIVKKSGGVLGVFSGLGAVLYVIPSVNGMEKKTDRFLLKRSMFFSVMFLTVMFVILQGTFGEWGLRGLSWPVLVLMSNVTIPGGFLQRWDVIFLGALLLSFFMASAAGSFYMKKILREHLRTVTEKRSLFVTGALEMLFLLKVGTYERAAGIFAKAVRCGIMPFLIGIPLLLLMLERVKRCRKRFVL